MRLSRRASQLRLGTAASTIFSFRGVLAQLVRAPPCHGGGCGFEPRRLRIFLLLALDEEAFHLTAGQAATEWIRVEAACENHFWQPRLFFAAVSVRADPLLPTAEGTTWEYDSTETLTGAAPVRSVVTVRAGKQLLDGKEVVKLETLSGNVVSKTELVSVDENGIACLARSGKDGKITKLNPPEPIIAAPLKVGAAWELEGEVAGIKMHQRFTVVAEENVTVPAGSFRAFHLQCEDSSLMSIKLDRWFVPGTGFVKETTVMRGPGMLQRVTLELNKITEVLSKPAASPSPAAPNPPSNSRIISQAGCRRFPRGDAIGTGSESRGASHHAVQETHRGSLERSGGRPEDPIQVRCREHLRPVAGP